jgi:hypothetical protein
MNHEQYIFNRPFLDHIIEEHKPVHFTHNPEPEG